MKRHCAMNFFFERAVISFIVISDTGTVKIVISASNGEIEIIMMTTPMIVSVDVSIMLSVCCRLCATLSMSLVTRLRRSPRGWLSMYDSGRRLSLSSTSLRRLLIERCTTPARMKLCVYESRRGTDVDEEGVEQHHVQLAEVDALRTLDAGDDDVGGVPEDPGSDHGQGDADHREHQHHGDAEPFRRHAMEQAPDHVVEVLRPLDRHPDAEAGTGVHRDALACLGDLLVLLLAALAVRPTLRRSRPGSSPLVATHATSSATNWDSTISW